GDRARSGVLRSPASDVGPDGPKRAVEAQPLLDRQRLRPPIAVDAVFDKCEFEPRRLDWELAHEDILEHLAPLAKGRLHEAPEVILLGSRQAPALDPRGGRTALPRLQDDQGRLDVGLWLERRARDEECDSGAGVVLDEYRQVAHLAGAGRDPFGDLALDHQDEALRPRTFAEQGMQDRAGDVDGQVRNHLVRRRHQTDQVLVERIAFDQSQRARRAGLRLTSEALTGNTV